MNIDYQHIHSVPRNPLEEVTRHHAACSPSSWLCHDWESGHETELGQREGDPSPDPDQGLKEIPVQNLTTDWYLSHSPGCFASVANITNDEPGRESDSDWIFVQTRLLSAVEFLNSDIDTFELWVKRDFKQVVCRRLYLVMVMDLLMSVPMSTCLSVLYNCYRSCIIVVAVL